MNIFPLFEGSFSVDSSKKFIPFLEGRDDPKSRPGSIFIHVQPFLIETSHDLILLDTGIGRISENGIPQLINNIRKAGFEASEITKVILSHLHSDHSLGLVNRSSNGSMDLNFKGAEHYVQKEEIYAALDASNGSYPHLVIQFFHENAQIKLIDGNQNIGRGIDLELTGGHSPYHQVVHLSDRMDRVFFGGDVLPEGIQLVRNYIAKYDFDGRKSMELRKEFGLKAAEEDWTCLYYHDNKPIPYSKVNRGSEGGFSLDYPASLSLR